MTDLQKIRKLILTNEECNIELALSLIKSQNIDIEDIINRNIREYWMSLLEEFLVSDNIIYRRANSCFLLEFGDVILDVRFCNLWVSSDWRTPDTGEIIVGYTKKNEYLDLSEYREYSYYITRRASFHWNQFGSQLESLIKLLISDFIARLIDIYS